MEYGMIGNCTTAALVHASGSIDWCCMPRFDSPSVFGRLLDVDIGGHCHIKSVGMCSTTQPYRDRTNVLETIVTGSTGIFAVDTRLCRKFIDY